MPHSRLRADLAIASLTGCIALAAYLLTLAPSVAPGDVAELQYIPARLGVPHPNGFPLYLLLGKLWSLLPVGSLAWRMNLLSAIFGALSVVALYGLLRVTALPRATSIAGALVWGFQRTFWVWSTVTDRYSLLFFLVIISFAALLAWRRDQQHRWLWLAALAAGAIWATHVAAPLYMLPIGILLLWPVRRQSGAGQARSLSAMRPWLIAAALFAVPVLLYAYFFLRGPALWAASPVDPIWNQSQAVLQGLIHPRFDPVAGNNLGYFRAGVPTDPVRVLTDFFGHRGDMAALFRAEFGLGWLILAAAGLLLALIRNRAWGVALIVLLVADAILASQYWQGNIEVYFLPALLALTVGLAETAGAFQRLAGRANRRWLSALAATAIVALSVLPLARNTPAAHADSRTLEAYWRDVLALPLEPEAGLLAHWSDLTPLWYFQQAEHLRPDLQGLYLPEIDRLTTALAADRSVYLSGPLSGWYADLDSRVRLVPWGPLVRLIDPAQPAPQLPAFPAEPLGVTFGDLLTLQSAGLPAAPVAPGQVVPLSLTWRSLAPVSRDLHISFRLQRDGRKIAQQDDRVISPWFPSPEVASALDFWSRHQLRVPLGLPEGDYDLTAVVYDLGASELRPDNGALEVRLGTLHVGPEPLGSVRFSLAPTLGPCARLEQSQPLDLTATVGALVDFDLLFALRCQPPAGQSLRFLLSGSDGAAVPLAPESAPFVWQSSGHQTFPVRLRISAHLAPGDYELRVEAINGQSGRALPRRIGPLPLSASQSLGRLRVEARPFATEAPALAHLLEAAFDNGIRILGYDYEGVLPVDAPITVTLAFRVDRPIPATYQVFIHLVGPDGAILAQRDATPGDLPTQAWLPGEVVSTTFTLEPVAPRVPGAYRLVAGLYDLATMRRSLVTVHGGDPADHIDLGALRLQ